VRKRFRRRSDRQRPAARRKGRLARIAAAITITAIVSLLATTLKVGPHRVLAVFVPPTPDRLATAQVAEPPSIRQVIDEHHTLWLRSLQCACDAGVSSVATGRALQKELQTVGRLRTRTQHWAISTGGWTVVRVRLSTPSRSTAVVTASDTRDLYQGFVPVKRTSGSYQTMYSLVRRRGRWQVADVRTVGAARRSIAIATGPRLGMRAAFILDDSTGRTLYAYNADAERYVASTAKMLTAIVAYQHLRLNTVVTVTGDVFVGGTSANLALGERLLARDVFYGMLLPSGNDAAGVLADATAGSQGAFAGLMNAEARRLHLWHSHFVAPQGLDQVGQYSTARDLAWLAHALLRNPFLAGVVRTRSHHATSVDGSYVHNWTSLNHLLGSYPGAIGVKTGTTPLAGANLVAAAARGQKRIIAVVLGDTVAGRFPDAVTLLNYGWRLLGDPPAGR